MGKFKGFCKKRDPRAANARFELLSILTIALAATLCGAKSATDMADFARRKQCPAAPVRTAPAHHPFLLNLFA